MKGILGRILGRSGEAPSEPGGSAADGALVTVVSGLPRSGTSMMMRVVEAAAVPVLADEIRGADSDNPKGYFEFERVKRLRDGDATWVEGADGMVVKVISALLEFLPPSSRYKVLFVIRDLDEVMASQRRMLENREEAGAVVDEEELRGLYEAHLTHIRRWLNAQPNFEVLYIDHRRMVTSPEVEVGKVAGFLDSEDRLADMVAAVDPTLYRQRVDVGSTSSTSLT
ncbi:MAG: sulfotransferase domain-containing protein [Longimicrobiales bacterium]